jgi:plastocyanin
MTPGPRRFCAVVAIGLVVAACGDDGNDGRLQAQRADERVDELRSATTAPPATQPTGQSQTVEASTPAPSVVEASGVVVPVVALDNTFRPARLEIEVGDEVRWENRGLNDHDVLSVDRGDWGVEVEGFGPGAVFAHVFTEPGEYRYFCSIHGNEDVGMVGTIVVVG